MMILFVAVGFIEQKAASGFLFFNRSEGALLPTGTFFHSVQKKHRSNHGSHGVSSFLFQVLYRFDDLHKNFSVSRLSTNSDTISITIQLYNSNIQTLKSATSRRGINSILNHNLRHCPGFRLYHVQNFGVIKICFRTSYTLIRSERQSWRIVQPW